MFTTTPVLLLAAAAFTVGYPSHMPPMPEKSQTNITDIDILQYALTLEHLEDKFYREGLMNFTLAQFEEAGFNETFYNNLKEVSYDETTHVSFLSQAITANNATSVAECNYTFGVTDVKTFIATASILEGVGVSAYLGAAASIVDKTYLTAAGAILTVESRHSAYLRAANMQSPFPQAFDAPLDFNEVYTLAAPFITSCPESNGKLPVKAFPMLALDTASMAAITTNASITLNLKGAMAPAATPTEYFAAWISVTGPTFVPAQMEGNMKFMTTVPVGFHGQSYVVITKGNTTVTDDTVVAGPAVVEVMGAAGSTTMMANGTSMSPPKSSPIMSQTSGAHMSVGLGFKPLAGALIFVGSLAAGLL